MDLNIKTNRDSKALEALWIAEAKRRVWEHESGEIPSIPADLVFQEAGKAIDSKKYQ